MVIKFIGKMKVENLKELLQINMKKLFSFLFVFILISCSKDIEEPVLFTLTVTANPTEGGTVSPTNGQYESGDVATVTATPNAEYVFEKWTGGATGTSSSVSVTMNGNKSVVANFIKKQYPLTIEIEGEGTVTETVIKQGLATDYNSGTIVELTAEPTGNWEFVEWTGDITSTENPIQITIDGPKTVKVKFMRYFDYDKPSYYLSSSEIWINYYEVLENNNVDFGSIAFGCTEVYGDFNFDGYLDWMTAPSFYQQQNGPMEVQLFSNQKDNKNFIIEKLQIEGENTTWNSRKALLGDFNGDKKPDVIYAEQGEDVWPTKGSSPSILLSTQNGYSMSNLTNKEIYLHTGASGDIDNDGDLDVILSSMHYTVVFLNNGDGSFQEKVQYSNDIFSSGNENNDIIELPPNTGQNGFVTMELFDIDNDGYLDLIAGGDENNLQSRIYFGNGNNFSYNRSKLIPFTDPWKAAIDFDFYDYDNDGENEIIVARYKNVYEGFFVELIDLDQNENYVIDSNKIDNSNADSNYWSIWLRVQDLDFDGNVEIISNDKGNLGYGGYHWEWNGSRFEKIN